MSRKGIVSAEMVAKERRKIDRKAKKKKVKVVPTKQPYVLVCCVNNSGFRNEYSANGMFGIGWMLGAAGIKAVSGTYDSHPISVARNEAVEEFLKNPKFTHLFFIDSDSVPKADVVIRLLQHDKLVVSGWYLSRAGSGLPVVMHIIGKERPKLEELIVKPKAFPDYKAYTLEELLTTPKDKKTGLVQVDGVGAGCLLIKREVFSHLSKPYFYEDHLQKSFGEDLFFGYNCLLNKVPIYIDINAFCEHFAWGLIGMRHVQAIIRRNRQIAKQRQMMRQKKGPM